MQTSRHTDARGLALNVKCYNLARDVPADAEGTDAQQSRAYDDTVRAWWHAAELLAQRHGFRKVWATGRMGGWLYTEPMPEPVRDDDGGEEPGEYPPAFVAELSELLQRAPEMYADALAEIIADDADEAQREAERDAMPARLALALANVSGKPAGEPCDCLDAGTHECGYCEARAVLDDYREMLRDADNMRDLTEEEAEALAAIAGDAEPKPRRALPVYTLAEVRNGTGWPRGQCFAALPEGARVAWCEGGRE